MDERYFETAYLALRKCVLILPDDPLDAEEGIFRQALIELCRDIAEWPSAISEAQEIDAITDEDDYIFDAANDEEFALWGDTQ